MEVFISLLILLVGLPAFLWLIRHANRHWNRVPGAREPEAVEADYRNAGIRLSGETWGPRTATGELDGIPFTLALYTVGRPHALLEVPAPGAADFKLTADESGKLGYERVSLKSGRLVARRHLVVEYPELETLRTWLRGLATLRR
jgi:hypothetical protein